MAEMRDLSDMSQKMLDALKKRVGGSSSASPPAKKSKGGEATPSMEKSPTREVIDLFEELTVANPSTPKIAKSKDSQGGSLDRPEQSKGGSELAKSGSEQMRAPTPPLPVLPKAKKGKEMLAHYMNRLVPEVSEQLASADNKSSLELLMGGVLKEFTRVSLS
ncbi:hypothetical protein CsatA_004360 [Cannabis sativa]